MQQINLEQVSCMSWQALEKQNVEFVTENNFQTKISTKITILDLTAISLIDSILLDDIFIFVKLYYK